MKKISIFLILFLSSLCVNAQVSLSITDEDKKEYAEDGITYTVKTNWIPYEKLDTFTCDYYLEGEPDQEGNYSIAKKYWHKNVDKAPELLNFWIDFFDNKDSLSQYSVQAIGDRPKVVNNSKIRSALDFYREYHFGVEQRAETQFDFGEVMTIVQVQKRISGVDYEMYKN